MIGQFRKTGFVCELKLHYHLANFPPAGLGTLGLFVVEY